jgi:hypothetical protein
MAVPEPSKRQHLSIDLLDTAVYTLLHGDKLKAAAASGGTLEFCEKRPWVMAESLLTRAWSEGVRLALLFAPAEGSAGLTHWGTIDTIEIVRNAHGGGVTRVRVSGLRPIEPSRKLSKLVLASTGKRLSEAHLRPYAVVRTPGFLG